MPDSRLFTPLDRRNFIINIAEGSLYIGGAAFISGQTVLPALIDRLGGGSVAVGSVSVILWVGLFVPQLFAARYVETLPWKKPWAIWGGAIQRVFILMLAIGVLAFGNNHPALTLAIILVCYACSQIGLGITTPGWFDLFAKVTPPERRGRLLGIRNSIGGFLSFLGSLLLTWMLAAFAFPVGYGLAFICAFVLQMASVAVQSRLTESQSSDVVERRPLREYLWQLPEVLKTNVPFRRFMVMCVFLVLANAPSAFFIVYALREFNGSEAVVGEFTLALVSVQVISGFVNGYIADHAGNKTALVVAASGMLAASVWALLAPSIGWFMIVFVFMGINLGSELMIRYNMSIDFGPVAQRSTYVGLMNTILAPFYLASIAGGWVVDVFGYKILFGCGAVCSVLGIVMLVFRVVDPRPARKSPTRSPVPLEIVHMEATQ